jgi:Na+/H+ antiporter NhaD/arsenite permease-like protein
MIYLKILFMILLAMAAVYAIFNIKDFFKSWAAWIWLLIKGTGKTLLWIINKIIGIFKKGK